MRVILFSSGFYAQHDVVSGMNPARGIGHATSIRRFLGAGVVCHKLGTSFCMRKETRTCLILVDLVLGTCDVAPLLFLVSSLVSRDAAPFC